MDRAGEPVPSLAGLFKRTPGSILLKMADIDGSRKNGARNDQMVGQKVDPGTEVFTVIYQVIIEGARAEGISQERLSDFQGLETGDRFHLLGQEALTSSAVEQVLERKMRRLRVERPNLSEGETEALFLMQLRRSMCVLWNDVSPGRTTKP